MDYIKSPLNYTGGKYKVLRQLFKVFPGKVHIFADLFAGGFNVGINACADTVICNDHAGPLISLYRYMSVTDTAGILSSIYDIIDRYSLSYENADGYYALRDSYNAIRNPVELLVLMFYSFNHCMRFNANGGFNMPFGRHRSRYNKTIENNLIAFSRALHAKDIVFSSQDFMDVGLSMLGEEDFVYCDPPYLLSTATYCDGTRCFGGWDSVKTGQLLSLLDSLDSKGVRFALSEMLLHNGQENTVLAEWCRKYNVHHINSSYGNCSYNLKKDRCLYSDEVVITNYKAL